VRNVAVSEERERIAREMHDSLAQVLGYVNIKVQAIQELLKRDETERAATQLDQLSEAARAAYADVREGILALRTSLGPGRTFLEALAEYLERWKEQSQVEASLVVRPANGPLHGLEPAAELQLLRIVQEALANVRKHAQATHVEVRIDVEPQRVETTVADNGRGFDPTAAVRSEDRIPHFGLSTMRERAESVGGSLEVVSGPGEGTRVVVCVPTHPTAVLERAATVNEMPGER
jgi:signal transduction histidine kinase